MESVAKNGTIYEFDGFRLVPGEELLLRNGEPIPLNIKSFAVLKILVERHGHLVSKSEIIDTVWEGMFVEEGSLTKAIWLIRQALGDTSKERFIQTVPRRGYRFVFPVSIVTNGSGAFRLSELSQSGEVSTEYTVQNGAVGTADKSVPAASEWPEESHEVLLVEEMPGKRRQRSKYTVLAACLVGIVAAVIIGWYGVVRTTRPGTPRSILVLPVAPINPADREVLYEIGIADALINRLSSTQGLAVKPLGVVRRYAGAEVDPLSAGREQQVDYVIASSYQIADGRIKVTGQLYNVASGTVEDSFNAQLVVSNILRAQDAIAREFTNQIMVRFDVKPGGTYARRGTENEEAYRLYLQAFYLDDKRKTSGVVEAMQEAVRLDPNYALAWAGLAQAYISLAHLSPRYIDIHEQYRLASEAIDKALHLDPELSEAYSQRCVLKAYYEYDFSAAEADCKRAVDLSPNSSIARMNYGDILSVLGRFDEAVTELRTAIDLDPASLFALRLYGNCLWNMRRYDEAAAQFKRVITLDSSYLTAYKWLFITLAAQGKEEEASEWFMKWLAIGNKRDEQTITGYKAAHRASGWTGLLRKRAELEDGIDFEIAATHVWLGNYDKAFEYLERSYQRRDWGMALLKIDPRLDPLRDDPRYKNLLMRVEGR